MPQNRQIKAEIAATILPRSVDDLQKRSDNKYFFWRTQCDYKVRKSQMRLECKIFENKYPPIAAGGMPGSEHNCRCWAEELPINIKIDEQNTLRNIKQWQNINLKLFEQKLHTII